MKLQSHDNGHYTIHITFTNDGSTLNINDKNKEYVHFDGENPVINKSALIERIKKERPNLEIGIINFKVTGCKINSSVHLEATVVPPTPATKYTVTYEYIGTVPEGAPSAPTAFEEKAKETVTIAQKPEFEGYTFEGWNTNDVIISDGKFEMPEKNVKLTGEWKKIKEKEFPIVIHYVDENGNPLAEDFISKVKYGGDFSQNSPNIVGYELVNKEDSVIGQTSITEDFEYTVVYKKIPVPIPTPDPDNPKVKPDKEWFGMGDGIVQTGDMGVPEIAALACLGALILALLIFFCGRKRKKNNNLEKTLKDMRG